MSMALRDETNVRRVVDNGRCFHRLGVTIIASTRHIQDRVETYHSHVREG